jgi:hypothetical protein
VGFERFFEAAYEPDELLFCPVELELLGGCTLTIEDAGTD